jgi:cell wall-associated NlpC family hydrolase
MLRHCKAQDIMYVPTSYKSYLRSSKDWKELGAIPQSRMRPGDVVVWSGHTEIYYGNGKRMGAHDYGGAESISVKDMYGGYLTVFRYQGG